MQKTMISKKMTVEIIYEKTSDLRGCSVTKIAVRHGIKAEMPFIKQVVIKIGKEIKYIKEDKKKPLISVSGNRGRWRDAKKKTGNKAK